MQRNLGGEQREELASVVAFVEQLDPTAYRADDDLVFAHPETGKPIDRSRLLKRYKAALKRATVRPVRFHDLRHTFGTHMASTDVPLRAVQEFYGHRDPKTTQRYADYAPSAYEAEWADRAFTRAGTRAGTNLRTTRPNNEQQNPL